MLTKSDPVTGERICQCCGQWYHPENEGADFSHCADCNEEIDMKVEEILLERRS